MASALQEEVTAIQANNYVAFIILAAVGYDYVLTFSDEIEYIWRKPWTRVSSLFFCVRYFGICSITIFALMGRSLLPGPVETAFQGNILTIFGLWTIWIFLSAADLVMVLRVWALFDRSRLILGILLTFYISEVVSYLVYSIVISTKSSPPATAEQVLDYSFCGVQYGATMWAEIIDSFQMALGTTMCLLVAIRFVKESLQTYKRTKQFQLNRYTTLLAREGAIYFFAVVACALTNLLRAALSFSTLGWRVLLEVVQSLPVITLVPRFVLNLRALYALDIQDGRGGDIDTGFGLPFSHSAPASMIMFGEADVEHNTDEDHGEEIRIEAREARSTGGGSV